MQITEPSAKSNRIVTYTAIPVSTNGGTAPKSKFEPLVKAYSPELYRYAYWQCRDRFIAEDLVQETFARAWRAWDKLRDDKAAKSWLYTILRHEHARLFERKRLDIDDGQELDDIVDAAASSVDDQLEMRDALKALPMSYREPLLLQVLGGFSCAEIAGMMKISEGAVMTRLTRARHALRKLLDLKLSMCDACCI